MELADKELDELMRKNPRFILRYGLVIIFVIILGFILVLEKVRYELVVDVPIEAFSVNSDSTVVTFFVPTDLKLPHDYKDTIIYGYDSLNNCILTGHLFSINIHDSNQSSMDIKVTKVTGLDYDHLEVVYPNAEFFAQVLRGIRIDPNEKTN